MTASAATGNARHDAESRLDSIEFHLNGIRNLLASTSVLSSVQQPAAPTAASVQPEDPTARFEQTVLATFGDWVLKQLSVEGLDVTEKVRAAHGTLSDLLGSREKESLTAAWVPGPPEAYAEELFSPEDLELREEDLDVVPVDIGRSADSASLT